MSEDTSEDLATDALDDDVSAADTDTGVTEKEPIPDEEIVIMASEYETLKHNVNELREQLMRQQAEFENVRKRLRKTADESGKRSLASFVRPILNEMDNFEMAIKAANPEKFNDFAMGVTMIHENMKNIFSGAGIQLIPAEGIFDPSVHEVVAEIEQEECQRGEIIGVQRNGYQINDQVIRAAQVIVAKPPQAQTDAEAASTITDEADTQD
jgi:molecular chaperone GrpE